jgi:hypothetical protein
MLGSSSGGAGGVVGDADWDEAGEGSPETVLLGTGVFSVCASERGSRTIATTIPTAIATTTTSPAVQARVLTITFVTVPRRHKRPKAPQTSCRGPVALTG